MFMPLTNSKTTRHTMDVDDDDKNYYWSISTPFLSYFYIQTHMLYLRLYARWIIYVEIWAKNIFAVLKPGNNKRNSCVIMMPFYCIFAISAVSMLEPILRMHCTALEIVDFFYYDLCWLFVVMYHRRQEFIVVCFVISNFVLGWKRE